MLKQIPKLAIVLSVMVNCVTIHSAQAQDMSHPSIKANYSELKQEAKQEIKRFAEDLKGTLIKGMKSEGPQYAIKLCNTEAPAIAAAHSEGDWTISRTSLKVRNPDNTPNKWQSDVLRAFEQRKADGEAIKTISATHVEEGRFYFMKAIPTGPLCTTCHGGELNPATAKRLSELYPNDQATGFSAGDIRGAFIASKPITK